MKKLSEIFRSEKLIKVSLGLKVLRICVEKEKPKIRNGNEWPLNQASENLLSVYTCILISIIVEIYSYKQPE